MANISEMRAKIEEIKKNAKLLELMVLKSDLQDKILENNYTPGEIDGLKEALELIDRRMEAISKHED